MKRRIRLPLLLLLLGLSSPTAWGKKIDFLKTGFSIALIGGIATVRNADYVGGGMPLDYTHTMGSMSPGYQLGAELGLQTGRFLIQVGYDTLLPGRGELEGTGTIGTTGLTFTTRSKMTASWPRVSLDFFPMLFGNFRVFFGGSYGLAKYSFTNAIGYSNEALLAGYQDFYDSGKASGSLMSGHGGLEFFFVDNHSLGIKGGYQQLKSTTFTSSGNSWNYGTPVTTGAELTTRLGESRKYDLSGIFAQAQLRLLY